MNLNLQGKRAVVCGSTQGIGKAVAIELSLLGAAVTSVARNEAKLKSVITELATQADYHHNCYSPLFFGIQNQDLRTLCFLKKI